MAKRYQIVSKPVATATGEPGRWKMWAHGATMTREEAKDRVERHKALGYISRILPV